MEVNTNEQVVEATEEKRSYTQEEVDAMIAEGRKRAYEDANKKADERFAKRQREAEKLSKMNETDRLTYELEQREQAIAERERQLILTENKATASQILIDKGISAKLVDFVCAEDAETMNANISLLEREFKASVKAEVEKRLGSTSPKKVNVIDESAITPQSFKKMSASQIAQLKAENPSLYNSLIS